MYQKRLSNDLDYPLEQFAPYRAEVQGLVVESTFNWYWLVDGLMKETRAGRDLLHKRSQLVRQRTRQVLSIENLVARNTGHALSGNEVKQLALEA